MTSLGWKESGSPMKVLLFGVLLSHLGTYMVVPLLPIFLKLEKGMTIAEIGLILAMSPFTFQAGSLLGGWLADLIGRRSIIAIGAWINAAAIVGFGVFDQLWMFISMGLLSGLGVGFNAPSTKAAIAALASEEGNKTTAFSLRGIAANIGIAIAGLFTYFILGGASTLIFYVSAGLYILLGIISWLMLPKGCGDEPCKSVPFHSYVEILKNKAFVVFSLVSILIWMLYTQLSLSLPLRAEAILPNPGAISLIWTVNAVIVVVLQTSISKWFIQKIHPMYSLCVGMLFIGGGLGSIYFATNFYGLLLSGAVFIIGEMFILPTMDATVSRLGTARMIGVFFGITNFISGIGEGAGKFAGGQLLSLGTSSVVPWLTFALGALVISGILAALRFWKPLQSSLAEIREEAGQAGK
ncbi:MFS transporter [Domibacillus mangrovi]|uniref:MFS transporter n=1 Tax=Domibacillus mangrovi TaxID=1714354 RepID=A0A1Q5P5Z0_9BACI|nr:MFS transporter [Domibacillus mangrovi]OKL37512.1 MFS transporter [Domibacillus mangrovi]